MLKNAYTQGYSDAFAKFAVSDERKRLMMEKAMARRGMAPNPDIPVTRDELHLARKGKLHPKSPIAGVDAGGVPHGATAATPKSLAEAGRGTNLPGAGNAIRRFGHGQVAHGRNLATGLGALGTGGGKAMAATAAKGLIPGAALGLGALVGAKKLFGKKKDKQQGAMV